MGTIFKYKDIVVEYEHVGACYHTAQLEAGRNPEYWDTNEARRFRELLSKGHSELAGFDEDKLRRCAVSFRKKPEEENGWAKYKKEHSIVGTTGGNGRGNKGKLPKNLLDHYASEEYALAKDACRDLLGQGPSKILHCVVCGRKEPEIDIEFHHCEYSVIKLPVEYLYIIPVCHDDHIELDRIRMKHSKRDKKSMRDF